jgi:hypothetical protein
MDGQKDSMAMLLQISNVTCAFVHCQAMLSVLQLMAMVCLLQGKALLLPRSYGDVYGPKILLKVLQVLTVHAKVYLLYSFRTIYIADK